MRLLKAKKLKEMHEEEILLKKNLKFEECSNAVILPAKKTGNILFGLGGVINSEGKYVKTSGIENRFGGYYEYEICDVRNEKVCYCGYLTNHWGHFLIESVARLWYCLLDNAEVDKYVFVNNLGDNNSVSGNYKEFFELLGIIDKLEIINHPTKFREVIVPELSYKRTEYYSEEYKSIFDRVRENALSRSFSGEKYKKIFLSRRWFAEKSEVGVEMLDDFFSRNKYFILYPEKNTLIQMIHLLENAQVCAAESGTLSHNFLFTGNNKKIIIIERQDTLNEVQVDVDKIRDNSVIYIDGYYTIYPVGAGCGPYWIAYNEYMSRFSKDYQLNLPNSKYLGEKYIKNCLKRYMKIYRKNHGYQWAFEKWQLIYADIFYEAYHDTCKVVGEYLSGRKVFKISQYCNVVYFKTFVKNIVKKFLKVGK